MMLNGVRIFKFHGILAKNTILQSGIGLIATVMKVTTVAITSIRFMTRASSTGNY